MLQRSSITPSKFVPRCRADGSYAAVQCMENNGCWCADPQGKPIQNTTTRTGRPNCPKKAKSNTRRSSPHNLNRPRRGCSRVDMAVFNMNLIRVFHSEHGRNAQMGQLAGQLSDRAIVDWKFALLDTNRNHHLDRQEIRDLKRLVRKVRKLDNCILYTMK